MRSRFLSLSAAALCVVAMVAMSFPTGPGAAARATEAPAVAPPVAAGDRFGVAASHIKWQEPESAARELEAVADAGIAWIRIDFAWCDLETTQGNWDFARMDRVVDEASSNGSRILGILGAAPSWANGGLAWNYPPTNIDAWRNYVATVAGHFRERVSAWEIWNEENISQFWMPYPNADKYVALLGVASAAIRPVDPEVKVVMGGVAGLGSDFLDACLKRGAADYVDAIAYHPYPETLTFGNYRPQEKACRDLVGFVRQLIGKYSSRPIEIWVTELGWTTSALAPPGVDMETQADHVLRSFINDADTEVRVLIWYNLYDEQQNAWNPEQNYGLLGHDFKPKPSYQYFQGFQRAFGASLPCEIDGMQMSCSRPSSLEAHSFSLPDGSYLLAVWKSDDVGDLLEISSIRRIVSADMVDLETGVARSSILPGETSDTGALRLTIGKEPVVLRIVAGPPEAPPVPPPVAGPGNMLADICALLRALLGVILGCGTR